MQKEVPLILRHRIDLLLKHLKVKANDSARRVVEQPSLAKKSQRVAREAECRKQKLVLKVINRVHASGSHARDSTLGPQQGRM